MSASHVCQKVLRFQVFFLALSLTFRIFAQESESTSGQAQLDQAVQMKLAARNMADLEKAIGLCEQALSAGLDEDSARFANSLLTSMLYERASRVAENIFERNPPDARWQTLRRMALQDLEKAIKFDTRHGESYLLMARLHVLPRGDRDRGKEAIEAALKFVTDDITLRSKVLLTRASYAKTPEERQADYNEAIRLDPLNVDAWRARGVWLLSVGKPEEAIRDLEQLLELTPDDVAALQAIAAALASEQKLDEALEYVERVIAVSPDSTFGYKLRARIHDFRDDTAAALEDLTRALDLQAGDLDALMMRARLWHEDNKLDFAKADVDRVLDLRPGLQPALLLRGIIAATGGRYADAAADLELLLSSDATNVPLRLRLASFYYLDKRPRKAIETCSSVLSDDAANFDALRLRADAWLSIGKHNEAIADYELALASQPDDQGVLNNLSWVLSTSTIDELRDGQRAIELAEKACEATKYEAAHILSTLAAGYAETGQFETAIKWSEKAVEEARKEIKQAEANPTSVVKPMEELKAQLQQLEAELDSYRQNKPWREITLEKEKDQPVPTSKDDLFVEANKVGSGSQAELGSGAPAQNKKQQTSTDKVNDSDE